MIPPPSFITTFLSVSAGVLDIIQIEHRHALVDAAGDRGDIVAQHVGLAPCSALHPGDAVGQRHPGAGDGGGAGAAVGLDHVAIDRDLALAERLQVDRGAQAAADQALDFHRAAALLAGGGLAAGGWWRAAACRIRR